MLTTISLPLHNFLSKQSFLYRCLLSLGLGSLSALSFAPFHLSFVLIISFYGLLTIIEPVTTNRQAFITGWAFGVGFFVSGLYWIANALKVVGLWYLTPLAALFLPMLLAIFCGLAVWGTWRLTQELLARVLGLTFFWSIAEWARGHILTGFPWNLIGYTWDLPVLQTTAVTGIYTLSLLTVLAACVLYTRRLIVIIPIWGIMAVFWGTGYYRITQEPWTETDVTIRLVQASIPQNEKWLSDHFYENINRHIALSLLEPEKPLKAVIWPEASVPTFVLRYPKILQNLAEAVPSGGVLLFGAPRDSTQNEEQRIHTSLIGINETGTVLDFYDKSHLVPFGEYFPFRRWINIPKLTHGSTDYTPGEGVKTLHFPGLPSVSPLICYEAIFSGHVVADSRPDWMLNITNDAWYGHSTGPYQHLHIVRTRAIEEGIPVIRVANNGISGVIDAFGRIRDRLELDEIGFIDFCLPKPLLSQTFYSKNGNILYAALMGFFAVLILSLKRRQQKNDR